MAKLRILYVSSEVDPFLNTSQIASFVRNLPTAMQERGMEIRILVPRFGSINERKNRLHEVVRLSGITIPMGDEEKPLTIKVASIPAAKLQVYFIDNEDYYLDYRTILVENSLNTLQGLAKYHRQFLKLPIIALTGSNGKTTTKELINIVLAKKFNVICPYKSKL